MPENGGVGMGGMGGVMDMFQEAAKMKSAQLDHQQREYHEAPRWLQDTMRIVNQGEEPLDDEVLLAREGPLVVREVLCEQWKAEGTAHVKQKEWEEAVVLYVRALSLFYYFRHDGEDRPLVCDAPVGSEGKAPLLVSALLLNIALCMTRLERWSEGVKACDLALARDPSSAKALFRRALCKCGLAETEGSIHVDSAIQDLEHALRLEPSNSEIRAELAKRRGERKKDNAEVKRCMQRLFPVGRSVEKEEEEEEAEEAEALEDVHVPIRRARRHKSLHTPASVPVVHDSPRRSSDPGAPGAEFAPEADRVAIFRDAYREALLDGATQKHGVWFDRTGRPLI
eukprot:Hpha_TRINITY_DN28211_c0_g1::TRINITY_DN28211_c0_g1_i1::g.116773::m.116773